MKILNQNSNPALSELKVHTFNPFNHTSYFQLKFFKHPKYLPFFIIKQPVQANHVNKSLEKV